MKRWMMMLAAVVAVAGLSAQNKPKDWAKFGRYEAANEALKAANKMPDAVFLGNSITDNWAQFDPDFFEKNNFAGRGISGQTTAEMLVRFRQDVLDLHPKVVLIMAGTNDIAQNNGYITLDNMLANIASMCELARLHGIVPIICSVPPAVMFGWRKDLKPAQTIVEFNAMLRQYAADHKLIYLDYWTALADERMGIPSKWCDDEVHPYLTCYIEVFEPMALEAVNRVLRPKNRKSFITPLPQQ